MGDFPDDRQYSLTTDYGGIRLLKHCVDETLERWPGGDPQEQENLKYLQSVLFSMVLEDLV